MKKAVVVSDNVGGFGNRMFKKGAEVSEKDFSPRTFDFLIKKGHLKVSGDIEVEVEIDEDVTEDEEDLRTYKGQSFDEMNKADIISELTSLGVDFKASSNKSILFDLLMEQPIADPLDGLFEEE